MSTHTASRVDQQGRSVSGPVPSVEMPDLLAAFEHVRHKSEYVDLIAATRRLEFARWLVRNRRLSDEILATAAKRKAAT